MTLLYVIYQTSDSLYFINMKDSMSKYMASVKKVYDNEEKCFARWLVKSKADTNLSDTQDKC